MKLEEGMYARTNEGISKIIDIKDVYAGKFIATDNKRGNVHYSNEYTGYIIDLEDKQWNKDHIKDNIIDLIEVGDYVNGEKVTPLMIKMRDEQGIFGLPDHYKMYVEEIPIKSIVTKEQFESMRYKVQE
jgi:hypothetical protein